MTTTTEIYAPAAARLADALPAYEDAKGVFYRLHTARFNDNSKAQIMATGLVFIHESYAKAELIEDAVNHLWWKEPKFRDFTKLEDEAKSEAAILHLIEQSAKAVKNYLQQTIETAQRGDVSLMLKVVRAVEREHVYNTLWQRVAELSHPEVMEPLQAMRKVVYEAANRVLDDLEDNADDVTAARFRARWVRKSSDIIGMKELEG